MHTGNLNMKPGTILPELHVARSRLIVLGTHGFGIAKWVFTNRLLPLNSVCSTATEYTVVGGSGGYNADILIIIALSVCSLVISSSRKQGILKRGATPPAQPASDCNITAAASATRVSADQKITDSKPMNKRRQKKKKKKTRRVNTVNYSFTAPHTAVCRPQKPRNKNGLAPGDSPPHIEMAILNHYFLKKKTKESRER